MEYYSEQALKELQRRKNEYEMLRKAWARVERVKTKSGEDFKVLSKNFINADIKAKTYMPSEKEISVYIYENGRGYGDEIDIDRTVYSDSDEAKEYEKQGRLIERGKFLHPFIELTTDEIEQEIAKRIEYYDHLIAELSGVLLNFDKIAEHIVGLREEANAYLKEQPTSVYYVLRSILKEERL